MSATDIVVPVHRWTDEVVASAYLPSLDPAPRLSKPDIGPEPAPRAASAG
ncbi:MAG: hypothetical protein ABSA14_09900 [Acidimicrobiales bacterium]